MKFISTIIIIDWVPLNLLFFISIIEFINNNFNFLFYLLNTEFLLNKYQLSNNSITLYKFLSIIFQLKFITRYHLRLNHSIY